MALGCALTLMLVIAPAAQAQQIIQVTSGWCSPTVANVVGDVVIKCIGVPPPLHKKLSEELERLKVTHHLEVQQLVAEANDWVRRYNELNKRLQQLTGSPAEIQEIQKLIASGKIEAAAARLDAGIERYDKHVATLAEYHYLRAGVAVLSFDRVNAMRHIRLAYQYQPANPTYLLDYASTLIEQGQFAQAENLIRKALPALRERAGKGSAKDSIALINALDKLGATLISSNRTADIDALSDEALKVVKRLASAQEENEEIIEALSGLAFSLGRNDFIAGRMEAADKLLGLAFGWNLNLCSKKSATFCGTAANAAMITGEVDKARGNYARAVKRYQLALDTLKWYEGTSRPLPSRARILIMSADAWLKQNRFDEAEKNYRAILDTWRQGEYLGHQHRVSLAHAHNKLGEFSMNRGQAAEGEASFRRALSLTKGHSGPGIEDESALALMNIGHMYVSQRKGAEARPYAMPAAETFRAKWEKAPNGYRTFYARSLFVLGLSQMLTGDKKNGCATLAQVRKVEPRGAWDRLSVQPRALCTP